MRRHLVSSLSGMATAVRTVLRADLAIEGEPLESQWTVGNIFVQEAMNDENAAGD